MARQLSYSEVQRYQSLVDAAGAHAARWLNAGGADANVADVHNRLRPEQRQAMERLVRRSSVDAFGRPQFGGRGPIRPGRARALRSGLETILADRAAAVAPPATNDVPAADQYLDIGLRTAFAEDQTKWFAQRAGVRPPRLFRSRNPESQVYAVAAKRLVRDIADRSGMSPRAVTRHLLNTPPNLRFDAAAGLIGARRGTGGMSDGQQAYAHAAMASAMRGQFGKLGRTASGFDQIGKRWKRQPWWVKGLAVLVVATNLHTALPLLLIARATRAIQRSQRVGHRFMARRHAGTTIRAADATLRHELNSAYTAQPLPVQQPGPQAYPPQRPAPAYTQQRPAPAHTQQPPAPAYAQQQGPQGYPQQQVPQGYPQQPGPVPVYAQQPTPAPAYAQQQGPQGYTQQGPPGLAPQQGPPGFAPQQRPPGFAQQEQQAGMGGGEDDTVRLSPGWAAATTGSPPLQGVTGDATPLAAPSAASAPSARPAHQQRATPHENPHGRNA